MEEASFPSRVPTLLVVCRLRNLTTLFFVYTIWKIEVSSTFYYISHRPLHQAAFIYSELQTSDAYNFVSSRVLWILWRSKKSDIAWKILLICLNFTNLSEMSKYHFQSVWPNLTHSCPIVLSIHRSLYYYQKEIHVYKLVNCNGTCFIC